MAAAEKGSPEPLAGATETEAAAGPRPGPVPTKRMRIDAAANESVGGSNTGTEEVTHEAPDAAAVGEEGSSTSPALTSRPRPLRIPPYPMDGNKLAVRNWMAECRRIREISAQDPRRNLLTRREPKDPRTTNAVVSPTDKVMVRGVARSVVNISSSTPDGSKRWQCTGIIMGQRESNEKQHNLVVTCSKFISNKESKLLDPLPKAGNGAPVIDHDGNIAGMAFYCNPNPSVLSISTIIRCIDMWMTFGRIARPICGLGLRTFELLDVSLQEEICLDHGINNGFIVDRVSYDSAAPSVGILHGDMIVSLDEQHAMTLPQLEDHFLKLGWIFLNNPSSKIDLKLEVYDLMNHNKTSITLPLQFCDT